jgi:hypothetical protein
MTRRLLAAIVTVALALGITIAASPASATSTNHTLAQTEAKLKGMSVGPNSYTAWGQATVNGTWTSYLDCHNKKHYAPKLTITNHNPTVTARPLSTSPTPDAICTPGIGPITADSWYNPASWDWAHIWGSIWDTIHKCITGAVNGTISNMTVLAAATAMTGGADLVLTPEGLVVVALGSCFAKIGW